MDERKNQQKLESSWIMSRHLDKAMNHDDVYLLNQEIETQISLQRDIYMLWYWRSRINHEFDVRKGNSIADAIADIFSPQEFEAAKKIKRIQGDFAFGGRPFSQLTPKEKYSMELRMRWRYHALEWILNDESWYDTSTDT